MRRQRSNGQPNVTGMVRTAAVMRAVVPMDETMLASALRSSSMRATSCWLNMHAHCSVVARIASPAMRKQTTAV